MVDDRGDVAVLVLAGGAARRFGSDKTRAELAGRPVLTHTLDAVAHVGGPLLVIGPWAPEGWIAIVEPSPRLGPAPALAFALTQVDTAWALVIGGDHPLLQPALVDLLVRRAMRSADADAVVPVRDGRDEPLVACYRTSVADVIRAGVEAGDRSMRAVLAAIEVDRVPESDWRTVDPDGRSFLDVDEPADLAAIEALLDA
jgi:molybdopterin-guanine dinucleotide biosynthesis protein A